MRLLFYPSANAQLHRGIFQSRRFQEPPARLPGLGLSDLNADVARFSGRKDDDPHWKRRGRRDRDRQPPPIVLGLTPQVAEPRVPHGVDGQAVTLHPEPIDPALAARNRTDMARLVGIFPPGLKEKVAGMAEEHPDALQEIRLYLDKPPKARLYGHTGSVTLSQTPITDADLQHIQAQLPPFSKNNRSVLEGTLHRVSGIFDTDDKRSLLGLTLRVGRSVGTTIDNLVPLLESGKSILIVGPPGAGKTTKLREIARHLSLPNTTHGFERGDKNVVIVDRSREIGGEGRLLHPAIGDAIRLKVAEPALQYQSMLEAVENHTPDVVIVDELSGKEEVEASRVIVDKGVQLIATAHANDLTSFVRSPMYQELIGGVTTETVGDRTARRMGMNKTHLVAKNAPTFDILVFLKDRHHAVVYPDAQAAVIKLLNTMAKATPDEA